MPRWVLMTAMPFPRARVSPILGGGFAPDKDDAVHIQHFSGTDDLLVEQPGEQQGLALAISQHIAHHIAGEGAGKFVVVLRRAAQQAAPSRVRISFIFMAYQSFRQKAGRISPYFFLL